nr:immune inhibitor A [candidate division Zixibacteria bacterium]
MSYFKILSVALVLVAISVCLMAASGEIYVEARIILKSKSDFIKLSELPLDIVGRGDNFIKIITTDSELKRLESLGLTTEIIHPDLKAFYKSRLTPDKDMGGYKTLEGINAYLDTLIADHPAIFSQKISIGQTIEGRDMWAVKISDNPELDEDEPEVLYTAAIHCREVITPEVLFYFMDYLADNYGTDPDVTDLVDNRELWFIPLVNPDGYYYNQTYDPDGGGMWRKNRRDNGDGTHGVDLNRNFGYEWGYDNSGSSPYPSDPTYRGTGPFSEPETQNLRDFHNAHDFIITLYYHSYSNFVLYPWGYETILTSDHDIFAAMADTISDMNGYDPGTAWMLLYPVNGGSDDWSYGEQTTKNVSFGITIEVGGDADGFWPSPSRIPALVSENLAPNLFLARLAGNIYQLRAPEQPILTLADTVNAADYTVSWSHDDTLNPALAFELVELQNYQQGLTDSAVNFENWINDEYSVSTTRYYSAPSSFYSGEDNNLYCHFQTRNQVKVSMNDSLKFWTYYDIETDWDYAYVEVSLDGIVFTPIEGNITTEYDPYGNNRGHGITGSSGGWIEAVFDLSVYADRKIYIRFTYETDSYTTEEGFYVDDISPIDRYGAETLISSDIADSNYTFTDKPEGTYYYKVRAVDAENQWGEYSVIRKTEAVTMFLCGDADNNGGINILDVTFLIAYLYKEGPAPNPTQAADVNNSGEINILDVTYFIKYLYTEGPEPNCP